jgi:aspartate 1-decarboxylase
MLITVLKSKIHRATITDAKLEYEGSLAIDKKLMASAKLTAGEKIQVVNFNNRNRFETYVIEAPSGCGQIGLRGPAARLGQPGDKISIFSWAHMTPIEAKKFKPSLVYVDGKNKVRKP